MYAGFCTLPLHERVAPRERPRDVDGRAGRKAAVQDDRLGRIAAEVDGGVGGHVAGAKAERAAAGAEQVVGDQRAVGEALRRLEQADVAGAVEVGDDVGVRYGVRGQTIDARPSLNACPPEYANCWVVVIDLNLTTSLHVTNQTVRNKNLALDVILNIDGVDVSVQNLNGRLAKRADLTDVR